MDIEEMRAERDRLDAEITSAEKAARDRWNEALDAFAAALGDWLCEHKVEVQSRDRKNAVISDVGHGALEVTLVYSDEQYGPGALRMVSGKTLTLEWSEVPELSRALAIVAVLLNITE
jgi:hypothetical protein